MTHKENAYKDYDYVRRAIEFISANHLSQPSLAEIATHIHLSPTHFQKLFKRWAGISPKEFLQAVTLNHARILLKKKNTLLDTSWDTGMSGPGRLHDLFVSYEAMTPGDYKMRGKNIEIAWGFHPCPFGSALIMVTKRGLAGLAFADNKEQEQNILKDMQKRWPKALYVHDENVTQIWAQYIFNPKQWKDGNPLRLILIGSDFEIRIWETLLKIPAKKTVTYSDIARHIGQPKAARAVGSAVGRNPISFVVPCHRVIGKSGNLSGYHWGLTRKKAILGWENQTL